MCRARYIPSDIILPEFLGPGLMLRPIEVCLHVDGCISKGGWVEGAEVGDERVAAKAAYELPEGRFGLANENESPVKAGALAEDDLRSRCKVRSGAEAGGGGVHQAAATAPWRKGPIREKP